MSQRDGGASSAPVFDVYVLPDGTVVRDQTEAIEALLEMRS